MLPTPCRPVSELFSRWLIYLSYFTLAISLGEEEFSISKPDVHGFLTPRKHTEKELVTFSLAVDV